MENGELTADAIIRATEYYMKLQGKLKLKTRKREIVFPRQLAIYLIRKMTHMTLEQIGELFTREGRPMDHATILYATRVIPSLEETNYKWKGKTIPEMKQDILKDAQRRAQPTTIQVYRYR